MSGPVKIPHEGAHLRLLLVEDEALVSMHMEQVLESLGHEVLARAPSIRLALAALERTPPDAAVLDVNLNGERVTPVAEALAVLRIPFVLMTGYSDGDLHEPPLQARPLLSKPVQPDRLKEALDAIGRGRSEEAPADVGGEETGVGSGSAPSDSQVSARQPSDYGRRVRSLAEPTTQDTESATTETSRSPKREAGTDERDDESEPGTHGRDRKTGSNDQ